MEDGKDQYPYKTSIIYGGEKDWVDKQGAKFLSEKYENIQTFEYPEYGHMMPLYPKVIQEIFKK